MRRIVVKWIERAKYDLATAKSMLRARRYLYVAFMCQQSLEKILKAVIISRGKEALRIHNLVRLAEDARLWETMEEKYKMFLADLTPFAIEARYGEYKKSLSEIINRKTAEKYLEITKEVYKCIEKKLT